ncbi:MAG: hypothetical protein AMS21_12600 [Gemmatimonas sp. SG8_38_2]|nr:MAG: hypothetical protein AMS21_12600 [Gemmatimonas sp. SG8_38_2]
MRRYHAAVLAFLLALAPSPLAAQTTVGLSAFGGVYLPTSDLFDGVVPIDTFGPSSLKFKQKTGWTLGARVAVWPSARIGIEAEAAYVSSDVEGDFIVAAGGQLRPTSGTESGNLFLGSLNLVYALIKPPLEPLAITVSGGVGLVSRGGDAWNNFEDTSDIAGVLGLGLKYGIARALWLRFDLRDYISSFDEKNLSRVAIQGGGSKLQNDLLVVVGVEWFLTPGS